MATAGDFWFLLCTSSVFALTVSACPGPDHLTEPIVSEGGAYFTALQDAALPTGSGGASNHGDGGAALDGGGTDAGLFDWGPAKFDKNGGSMVTYQDHYNGEPCFVACHGHGMTIGGTVYRTNGIDTAANIEIGVWLGDTLFSSYSGTNGNFFTNFLTASDWSNATIAVRSDNGSVRMPPNTSASGDCNHCHTSSHRIIAL